VEAASAILIDPATLQVLVTVAPDDRRPIASLTKVMSAMVVLDRVADLSEAVTIGSSSVGQIGSVLGLRVGERITVEDLLYGMLLGSANDAAVALAEHVSGTEPAFAEAMDERAADLGLDDTDFESATGLDNDGFSTAREAALLFGSAMSIPTFAAIEATRFQDVRSSSEPTRHIQNRNVLLWLLPGATGGKTGFTTPAGYCVVASAQRNGHSLVVAVLGASEPAFDAAATLLEYGFDTFVRVPLMVPGQGVGAVDAEGRTVVAVASTGLDRLVRVDLLSTIERRFTPAPIPPGSVEAGDHLGSVSVLAGGQVLGTVDAVAAPAASTSPTTPRPQPGLSIAPGTDFWAPLRVLLRAAATAFL
jgi:D-alanyl-D-alanine carboxypeptidase (penicillin-binding protein 5/6)